MATTTKPSVDAKLYAGAVDAIPMTVLEMSPNAPDFRPFCGAELAGSTVTVTSAPFNVHSRADAPLAEFDKCYSTAMPRTEGLKSP
jgi:hypothetical protein